MLFNDDLTVETFERCPGTDLQDFLAWVVGTDEFWNAFDDEFLTVECKANGFETMSDYAMSLVNKALDDGTLEYIAAKMFLRVYVDWFNKYVISFDDFGDVIDFDISIDLGGRTVSKITKVTYHRV